MGHTPVYLTRVLYSHPKSFSDELAYGMRPGADQVTYDRFLFRLHPDRERAGEQYELIRRKLVKFFEWRGCAFADEPADEVLRRILEKLAQGEEIRDPFTYCYGVARLVLLELRKNIARERAAISELQRASPSDNRVDDEKAYDCLSHCLDSVPPESRQLIQKYYTHEGGGEKIEARKALADQLSIPLNALRIRAHRLRQRLEECVQSCMQKKK
jgi:DNA-directed RNA polymerase specialized sigma24 family protein